MPANGPAATPGALGSIGSGLVTPSKEDNLPTPQTGIGWYAAVKVSATGAQGAGSSSVLTGSAASDAWQSIIRAFGIDNGEDSYSFVITPTIYGVTMPPLTAIQIDHVKAGGLLGAQGEQLTIHTNQNVYSAWVPVDAGATISFTVADVGSTSPNFSLLSDVASVSSKLSAAGLWASPAGSAVATSMAALNAAATPIQNAINNGRTIKLNSSWSNSDFPLGSSPTPKGYTFTMRDIHGALIATITVEYVFRRTLRNGPEALDQATYPNLHDDVLDTPSYQYLDTNGTTRNISDALAANTALVSDLGQQTNPTTFWNACKSFSAFLQSNGLDSTDSVFYRVKYLQTIVNNTPTYAQGFWTQCVQERLIANHLNISSLIHTTKELTYIGSTTIGDYITNKSNRQADEADVLGMLSDSMLWQQASSPANGQPINRTQALQLLAALPATDYYCNFPAPINDLTKDPPGVTMFLHNASGPDKLLSLTSAVGTPIGSQAQFIAYRDPTTAELTACTNYRKAQGKPAPVGG